MLHYDSEEEYDDDVEDGIAEEVRHRRQQLRVKWRSKGSGLLGASVQTQAQRAQRSAARRAAEETMGGGVSAAIGGAESSGQQPGAVSAAAIRALRAEADAAM